MQQICTCDKPGTSCTAGLGHFYPVIEQISLAYTGILLAHCLCIQSVSGVACSCIVETTSHTDQLAPQPQHGLGHCNTPCGGVGVAMLWYVGVATLCSALVWFCCLFKLSLAGCVQRDSGLGLGAVVIVDWDWVLSYRLWVEGYVLREGGD